MNLFFDIKYSLRVLLKTPGFTALTVVVITIGLGVSVFMVSVVNSLIVTPIDFKDGERLTTITRTVDGKNRAMSLHYFQKLKEENQSYEVLTGYSTASAVLSDGIKSVRYQGIYAASDFFEYTSVEPLLGRVLNEADQLEGALPVAVIGYDIWQNYFAGDNEVIGKTAEVNRQLVEIVGVMPQDYLFPESNQLWFPLQKQARNFSLKDSPWLIVFAKLKSGVSIEQADLELKSIMANSPELKANPKAHVSADIYSFKRSNLRNATPILYMMLSAGFFVLALSCINVGNLLLARANMRAKETAIRVALGAPRARLISQMLWESLLICSLGGVLAVLLASWGLQATTEYFLDRSTDGLPFWLTMGISGRDVLLAVVITVITAFVTGFIPAWKTSGGDFNAVLKDASKTSLGKTAGLVSKILVAVEIALSCGLMIIAGVVFILVQQAVGAGYGISLDKLLTARVNPLESVYAEGAAQKGYFDRVLEDVSRIPSVKAATLMSHAPTGWARSSGFEPEGQEFPDFNFPRANYIQVYPNTFDVLAIPLLEGRVFNSGDTADSPHVTVISKVFADKNWPNESAIGKRLRIVKSSGEKSDKWLTVVGVVPQLVQGNVLNSEQTPNLYIPFSQMSRDALAIVIRSQGNPYDLLDPLADVLHKIDPNIPMYRAASLNDQAKSNRSFWEFVERIFALFAIAALIMAATGIYGVMASHVEQRTQEIGIRRAIGATKASIVGLLMRQSVIQLLFGFLFGIPMAYLLNQIFVRKIGADGNVYLLMYAIVPLIIAGVVFTATLLATQRAIKLEPAAALRYE